MHKPNAHSIRHKRGTCPGQCQGWDWERDRSRVQGQAILRAGATCNALFMMPSGTTLASRALLPRLLLLQLRESCGSCQRCESRSYPQKKKIEQSRQKVHRKSERAGHTCAVLRDRAIKLQFWQVSQAARNPFSFERKCLWSGAPTWSRSPVCKPCELPKKNSRHKFSCTRGAQKFSQII